MDGFFVFSVLLSSGANNTGGSILSFDKSLLINLGIQYINITLLTAILVWILYKPVKNYLADRTLRIQGEIDAALKEREKSVELKEKYEELIAGIEKEREEILRKSHELAMEKSDQLLFNARREAELVHSRAHAELELERENIMDEMQKEMIEISYLVASRFITVSIDRETQDRYVEEAIAHWRGGADNH